MSSWCCTRSAASRSPTGRSRTPAATPAWEAVRGQALNDRSPEALEALEFTFASPYVPLAAELRAYAAALVPARAARSWKVRAS